MAVSDLLRQSVTAHGRAALLRKQKDREQAATVLAQARALRLQALSEDPERTDPAWAAERVSHDEMMIFYQDQLGDA